MARIEQRIVKQCMRQRSPLPERIKNAPRLWLGLELYYDAFWELSTCRASGMAVMPIPWSAMRDYASTFGLDEAQEEDLFYLVRAMDNAYIEHFEKGKKTSPGEGHQSSSKGDFSSLPKR